MRFQLNKKLSERVSKASKVSKVLDTQGATHSKGILKFSKVNNAETESIEKMSNFRNFRNTLDNEKPCEINNFRQIRNFRQDKDINIEISVEKMDECLHNSYCQYILFDGLRQICRKNNKPIFNLRTCPIEKWIIDKDYDENNKADFKNSSSINSGLQKEQLIKKEINTKICPARCKISGKCYGTTYFIGKTGKGELCEPEKCEWIDKME